MTTFLSFEIHQKAKARWADLDIALGHFDESAKKLQDILATDTDWRRRTWAQSWLIALVNMAPEAKRLAACGPKALQRVLASLDKPEAARRVGAVVPKTLAGLSLAEMETLSAKNGAPMRAFKIADFGSEAGATRALAELPLPAIVHLDDTRGFDESKGYFADRVLHRAPMVALNPDVKVGQLPANMARALRADKGGLAQSLFKTGLAPSGHYLVVEKFDANTRQARVFDPQENRFYHLSARQLASQWSGKGLALAGKTRLASVEQEEKQLTRGGCCGSFRPPVDTGCCPDGQDGNGGCAGGGAGGGGSSGGGAGGGPHKYITRSDERDKAKGSPVWSVNRTNQNVFIRDTPLWVKTAKGPDVEISLSYNSQDALSQRNTFGNKWMFSYASYVVEDTQAGGGQIIAFMPDGSQDTYSPNGSGGFTTSADNSNRLAKLSNTRYELLFPDGSKSIYDIPQGTTSLQPFLIELRDPWGFGLQFGYDQNVRLTTITDAGGGVTQLNYNAANKVSSVWDPAGRHASFSYDTQGNLIECVDMEGHAFQYTYNSDVYVTRLNTAQGPWTFSHSYGYPDRYLTVTDPAGQSEQWYSNWWGPSNYRYTDKRGVVTNYGVTVTNSYSARVSNESFADGSSTSKSIDPNTGLATQMRNADGGMIQMAYNAQSQPTQVIDPKGGSTRFTYAPNGIDITSIVNALGQTVATYGYDQFHQPTSITDVTGNRSTISYTAWGAPASVSANGQTTTFAYHASGQLASTSLDGVTLSGTIYGDKGRVKTQTDEAGLSVGYEYNNLDHVTKEIYPDGTTVEYDYTCCGLPGVIKDRAGRRSYYDYDPMRRLSRVQDANGDTLQADYDGAGNLVRLLDAKGQVTRWDYDGLNRLTKRNYPHTCLADIQYCQGYRDLHNHKGRVSCS